MPKDRPTREQGRLITGLLQTGRTSPDGWLRDEREAVTRLHTWAHGAPPKLGARPQPVHGHFQGDPGQPLAGRVKVVEDAHGIGAVEVEYRRQGEVRVTPSPHGTRAALAETDPRLVEQLTRAGDEWGPLGVALAAAAIAGPDEVWRQLGTVLTLGAHDPEGCDANLDALRAEVARLSALLDDAGARYESMRERRNRARDHAVEAERERDELRARAVEAEREVYDLRAQRDELTATTRALTEDRDRLRRAGVKLGAHPDSVELHVNGPGTVVCDGRELRVVYEPYVAAEAILADHDQTTTPQADRRPSVLDDDPRRPRLDSWPDDAVTLTYTELRNLVALHLRAADSSVLTGSALARAVCDGEVPLRVSEVLDR